MGFAIAIKAGILAIFAGELGNEQAIEYIRYSWLNWIVAFLIVLAVLVLRRFLTWYINHRVLLVTKATASDDDDKFVKEMHKMRDELAGQAEVHVVQADLLTVEGVAQTMEMLRQKGPVDVLVNTTPIGTVPEIGEAMKLATTGA